MHMAASTTTQAPMKGIVPYIEHGCNLEGDYYPDGAQVAILKKQIQFNARTCFITNHEKLFNLAIHNRCLI